MQPNIGYKMNLLGRIVKTKCPRCGKGDMFVNKSVFPLSQCFKTHQSCASCRQPIKGITDSAPTINYALSVIAYAMGFVIYALIWGITYKDNSIYHSLIFSTVLVIVLQPWLIRYSKVIYLYLYIKFRDEG